MYCGLVEGSGEVLNCMSYIGYMVCEYIASRLHTLLAHLFPLLLNIWEFSCHLHSNNTLRIIQPPHGNNCRSHMSHTYAYTYMVILYKEKRIYIIELANIHVMYIPEIGKRNNESNINFGPKNSFADWNNFEFLCYFFW